MNDQRKIRVLVADDQEIVRVGLVALLSLMPSIEVVGYAANGQQAYRQCKTLRPDVVLMDLMMPVMDGIEATALIRNELPSTRVIMVTSHERDEDVFGALAAGADGYCLKTISADQLRTAISTIADGGAWLDAAIAERVLKASSRQQTDAAKVLVKNSSPNTLSEREMDVLKLLVEGLSNKQMAERVFVSTETIKSHMRHIMEKLAVSDRTQAAVKAIRERIV
jgi:DNA-binding NarL/FixJ family response regulator